MPKSGIVGSHGYPIFMNSSFKISVQISSVTHRVWFFATPWITARQDSLSITNSQSPPKPMSIKSVMPSNHLILCHPLLLSPSIFPSIRVFSNESALHMRWPKYWGFSFNISPSSEHPGLISFRMDWLDLLAVQGTLKSLLQHHSSKASILRCSAFFIVQLSHPYMTTGQTIALTRRTLYTQWNITQPWKTEIMPSAATWVDLEIIILSEVSQTKTNIIWYSLYMESKTWYKWTYL